MGSYLLIVKRERNRAKCNEESTHQSSLYSDKCKQKSESDMQLLPHQSQQNSSAMKTNKNVAGENKNFNHTIFFFSWNRYISSRPIGRTYKSLYSHFLLPTHTTSVHPASITVLLQGETNTTVSLVTTSPGWIFAVYIMFNSKCCLSRWAWWVIELKMIQKHYFWPSW